MAHSTAIIHPMLALALSEDPMTLPHVFKRIRLHLARSKEFPSGSARHGYEFVAPLDEDGHINPRLWHEHHGNCGVRRFWGDEEHRTGRLLHKPGGQEHARWVFDYDATGDEDDETGYRFGAHKFVPGEYVTISESDGERHTFQVISVQAAA